MVSIFAVFVYQIIKAFILKIILSVYMDFPEGSDSLTLVVDTNAASKEARKWNLEVKQISCDSTQLGIHSFNLFSAKIA